MTGRARTGRVRALCALALCGLAVACGRADPPSGGAAGSPPAAPEQTFAWPAGVRAEIDTAIAPAGGIAIEDGLAAAILIDVSGSMAAAPRGQAEPKIVSARRAALDLVDQFAGYAATHPGERVLLGVYEFSRASNRSDVREVIPMGAPDRSLAGVAIARMKPGGGTPIGSAVIAGKQALDRTGFTRRHLLVITDGDNRDGHPPAAVLEAIARRPELERPSLYFIAFDVRARRFNDVKEAGALVLEASDGAGLHATLDSLLSGEILVERE